MASPSAPIKIILKFTKPAPRPPAPVNLTPTGMKNLVGALSNTKDEIKIDYEGMKQALGLSSKSKKPPPPPPPLPPPTRSDEVEEDDENDEEEDTADDKVPAKKPAAAATPAAKRGLETEDDDEEDDAGARPGKKARKST
ncbi:hypothetical protein LTR84_000037 [Exophiala bonariae]|uniref:SRP9 domain-containing protein n=1 Tax=Exophiala bonariae TaxID=1690606 RepID=A0AAV9NR78_9EURO|nr:hypothetical protein LTR84_000037 [Exophiala bonariae]